MTYCAPSLQGYVYYHITATVATVLLYIYTGRPLLPPPVSIIIIVDDDGGCWSGGGQRTIGVRSSHTFEPRSSYSTPTRTPARSSIRFLDQRSDSCPPTALIVRSSYTVTGLETL